MCTSRRATANVSMRHVPRAAPHAPRRTVVRGGHVPRVLPDGELRRLHHLFRTGAAAGRVDAGCVGDGGTHCKGVREHVFCHCRSLRSSVCKEIRGNNLRVVSACRSAGIPSLRGAARAAAGRGGCTRERGGVCTARVYICKRSGRMCVILSVVLKCTCIPK